MCGAGLAWAGLRKRENTMSKAIGLDTWTGRRYYAVEIIGETPKKFRVRILTPGGVMLPGKRYFHFDEVVLVPKHAIFDMPEQHKIEQGYCDGNAGYGGLDGSIITPDARRF